MRDLSSEFTTIFCVYSVFSCYIAQKTRRVLVVFPRITVDSVKHSNSFIRNFLNMF